MSSHTADDFKFLQGPAGFPGDPGPLGEPGANVSIVFILSFKCQ